MLSKIENTRSEGERKKDRSRYLEDEVGIEPDLVNGRDDSVKKVGP